MKLLFFDIDGTILRMYGAGRKAVEEGLSERFGKPIRTQPIHFGGKTDPQILREVLLLNDIADHEDNMNAASEAYMNRAHRIMPDVEVEMMPNADVLIRDLYAEKRHELSLLTGNFEPMAYFKLAQLQLDGYFSHGAFGSDHEDRNQLPEIGIHRVKREKNLHFEPHNVVVIGDTPRDIECARFAGVQCIAVATGGYSMDELADADLVLPDFSDTRLFYDFLHSTP